MKRTLAWEIVLTYLTTNSRPLALDTKCYLKRDINAKLAGSMHATASEDFLSIKGYQKTK